MRNRVSKVLALLLVGVAIHFLAGCGDDSFGTVHQAGYSYDPANYGDYSVPVWWKSDEPTVLSTLKGDCAMNTGGRAEAITASGNDVYIVGFSTVCNLNNGDEYWRMAPAMWINGVRTDLETDAPQAEATSITLANGNVYIGGGAGIGAPIPVLWVNGEQQELPLPSYADTGIVTKVLVSGGDVYAAGFVHDLSAFRFLPGYWKNDEFVAIPLDDASYQATRPTLLALNGAQPWAGVNLYSSDPRKLKAALWSGGKLQPMTNLDFNVEPWTGVDALLNVEGRSLAAGFISNGEYGFPAPVYWVGATAVHLPVRDNNIGGGGLGEAYDAAMTSSGLFLSGYSSELVNSDTVVDTPCYWLNGRRHDRKAISAAAAYQSRAIPTTSSLGWTNFPNRQYLGGAQRVSGTLPFTETEANSAVAVGIAITP